MLLNIVDTLMLARFDASAVGAAGIASSVILLVMFGTTGIIYGMDPIVSQAHGRGDGATAGRALQRGLVIAGIASFPIATIYLLAEPILALIRADLAAEGSRYLRAQLPGMPFFLAFVALRQYLQSRGIVRPAMFVVLIANLLNAFLNWVLIFGHLDFPALGLVGSGIATGVVQIFSALALLLAIRVARLHRGAWTAWSRETFRWSGFREIFRIGVPIWIQIELELGGIVATTAIASQFSISALAGHEIAMKVAGLIFQIPLGVSLATSARVGHHLGAADRSGARHAIRLALGLGLVIAAVPTLLLVFAPAFVATLLSSDQAVVLVCAGVLPIVGALHAFDALQVVATGALRGQGRTIPATVSNFIGHWVLGLPVAAWLALRMDWGVIGIWWGITFGLAVVALILAPLALRSSPQPLVGARASEASL